MKELWRKLNLIFARMDKDKIAIYSGQSTMFIIISALPFLMLLMSLLQFFTPYTETDYIRLSTQFIPSSISKLASGIINELFSTSTIPIVSITSLTTLWSASKGVMSLLRGLEEIYSASQKRNYIMARLVSLLYTFCFMILICVTLFVIIIGKSLVAPISVYLPVLNNVSTFLAGFPIVFYIIPLTFVFAAFYRWLPGGQRRFKNQIWGAIFSSIGWVTFSAIYSFYVDNFAHYSYIYGSLTAIVLLMLWLYFCINILLSGAELNKYLEEREQKSPK